MMSIETLSGLKLYELNDLTLSEEIAKELYISQYQHFDKYVGNILSYKNKLSKIMSVYNKYLKIVKDTFSNQYEYHSVPFTGITKESLLKDDVFLHIVAPIEYGSLYDFTMDGYNLSLEDGKLAEDFEHLMGITIDRRLHIISNKNILDFLTDIFTKYLSVTDHPVSVCYTKLNTLFD